MAMTTLTYQSIVSLWHEFNINEKFESQTIYSLFYEENSYNFQLENVGMKFTKVLRESTLTISLTMKMTKDSSKQILFNIRTFNVF